MRQRSVRRSVSIVFAILFLASCVWLEPVRLDTARVVSDAAKNTTQTITSATISADRDLCTVEMLGNHATACLYRQTALRSRLSEKNGPAVSYAVGCILSAFFVFPRIAKIRQIRLGCHSYGMRLVRLLHKRDGKKRFNLLFS